MLELGTACPDFSIALDNGEIFKSSDAQGQNLVVFFYPRADTPGCTKESIAFSEHAAEFGMANTRILGISKDTVAKQAKFRDKHNLTVMLGADDQSDVCEQFGVWQEKSMYGKTYMGIVRATFLFNESGELVQVWPKVKVAGHAEEVLEAVRSL